MTKQRTFAADGTEQMLKIKAAVRAGQKKKVPAALEVALNKIDPTHIAIVKKVDPFIAGPTGDQVMAAAIARGDYSGVAEMDRQVLEEMLGRLVQAGSITSEQMAAALDCWDKAHSPAAAAPEPDPEPSPADSWTLMGVTMKKLWWIASGVGAALLVALVIKMIVKR